MKTRPSTGIYFYPLPSKHQVAPTVTFLIVDACPLPTFISRFYVWSSHGNQVVDQSPSLQGPILSSHILLMDLMGMRSVADALKWSTS